MYDEPRSDVQLSPLPVRDDGGFSPSSSESGMGMVGNMPSFLSTADVRDLESLTATQNDEVTLLRSSLDPSPTLPPGLTSHSSSTSSSTSLTCNPQNPRRWSRSRRRAMTENSVESLVVVGIRREGCWMKVWLV
jgi:hypothetical protein